MLKSLLWLWARHMQAESMATSNVSSVDDGLAAVGSKARVELCRLAVATSRVPGVQCT